MVYYFNLNNHPRYGIVYMLFKGEIDFLIDLVAQLCSLC